MKLELSVLKINLDKFADEFKLAIMKEIGDLAAECSSVEDFKSRLDELCVKNVGKTSLEILSEFSVRLPEFKPSDESRSGENSALQNELVAIGEKIDQLDKRDKSRQEESKS